MEHKRATEQKPRFQEWAKRKAGAKKAFHEALKMYLCYCGRTLPHKEHYPVCREGTSRCPIEGVHSQDSCIAPSSRKRGRVDTGFYSEECPECSED